MSVPPAVRAVRGSLRRHPRWRWMCLGVVSMGMMLSVVNVSIVNIALPAIAADFGVDVASAGWVVTAFMVTMATLLPVAGRAGDVFGRRRVFVTGVVVCAVGSVLCAFAWDASSLVAFRVVQGVGACAMAPTAVSYAAELFAPEERGAALGLLGGLMGLAPVLSLNLAGVLVGAAGWRSVFWFTPVIAAVVLAGAAVVLEEVRGTEGPQRFDLPGASLAAAGLVGVLLALSRGERWGWTTAPTVTAACVGLLGLVGFVVRERRTPEPMLDLGLFGLRSLRAANVASGASAAALFGTLLLLPFLLVAVLGGTPVVLALAISPLAISFMVVSPLAGRAMSRGHMSSRVLAASGLGVAACGTAAMGASAPSGQYRLLLPGMLALGVGVAASSAPITATAIAGVARARMGVASALPNISRYTGAALGIAVLGAVMHAAMPARLVHITGPVTGGDRVLVATAFRWAMVPATAFLVVAAIAALRMPPQASRRSPAAPEVPDA